MIFIVRVVAQFCVIRICWPSDCTLSDAHWYNERCSRPAAPDAAEPVIRGVLDEVIAVSKALGYKTIPPEAAEKGLAVIKSRAGKVSGSEPSMLVDVLWIRRTEHEVVLGTPVRIAQNIGVPVPRMEMLYAMVKASFLRK